jgi:hypothetical protein
VVITDSPLIVPEPLGQDADIVVHQEDNGNDVGDAFPPDLAAATPGELLGTPPTASGDVEALPAATTVCDLTL